ncbi:MAG: hypothetical protein LC649_11180 [Bacteroidales bacterium]|nr:hypothetical protein [Bacteroidales bacterium]
MDDLDHELRTRNFRVITEPNPPSEGVRVAMIEHNGAPVELIEFRKGVCAQKNSLKMSGSFKF